MKKLLLFLTLFVFAFAAKSQTMTVNNNTSCTMAMWGFATYGPCNGALQTHTTILAPHTAGVNLTSADFFTAPTGPWTWLAAKARDGMTIPSVPAGCTMYGVTYPQVTDGFGGDPVCPQYTQSTNDRPIIMTDCNTCPAFTIYSVTYTMLPGGDVQVDIN